MRILRYVFMFCGDELNSVALASKLKGDYVICNLEEIGSVSDSQGVVSIAPLRQAVVDNNYDQVNTYHAWFASFLETNYSVLAVCGANDIRIFMEVFYAQGHQCNLEVFDREIIFRISKFNVALPISIYTLSEDAMTDWAKEIDQSWNTIFRN